MTDYLKELLEEQEEEHRNETELVIPRRGEADRGERETVRTAQTKRRGGGVQRTGRQRPNHPTGKERERRDGRPHPGGAGSGVPAGRQAVRWGLCALLRAGPAGGRGGKENYAAEYYAV